MAQTTIEPTTFGDWPLLLAAVDISAGEIACVNSAGYLTPGAVATGLIAVGLSKQTVSNAGGSAGAKSCVVMTSTDKCGGRRIFPLKNAAGGAAVVQASVGHDCFIAGPNTVRVDDNGGTCSRAGKVWGFDRDGMVLVEFDVDPDAVDVADLQSQIDVITAAAPGMQAVNATLESGTITISSGITVASNSEVVPVLIGALSGTTNFGTVGELKASRVNGAPGVGTVVIQAYGDDGALDADAAGAIRVLIFTPLA